MVDNMTYGYSADILEDLEMDYMSEYEFMESIIEELERKPLLTHDDYVDGIKAIKNAERKALVQDLVENWETINNGRKSGYDTLDTIMERHGVYDMREFDLILDTIDRLFKI